MAPHIEISQQMAGRSLADISQEELQNLMDGAREQAIQEAAEEDPTLTLGAIGSPYTVGPIDCIVALGHIVLLNEINSPFITGDIGEEGEDLSPIDCIKTLYVLGNGRKAVKPIMSIKERVGALNRLKPMVEGNPEMFERLMDRAESIAAAHADFELAAIDWYEKHFTGYDFQEVVDQTLSIIVDLMKTSEEVPGDNSKKKE